MTHKLDRAQQLKGIVPELQRLVGAIREGHLDERADLSHFSGNDAVVLDLVNSLVGSLVVPLRVASGSLAEIAAGRIPDFVIDDYQGELDTIKRNINNFLATMQGMHHEAQDLINAITAGRLHARGNDWDFEGAWRDLIRGMNGVVDAFEQPFQVASSCVCEVSMGRMPMAIPIGLRGEYGALAKHLNDLLRTIHHMTTAIAELSEAAIAGRLERRIATQDFLGDWQALANGINQTLNSALAPIQEAGQVLECVAAYDLQARVEGAYAGDHARIKESLNRTIETLRDAMKQMATSAEAVATGSEQIAIGAQDVTQGARRQVTAVNTISQRSSSLVDQSRRNAALSKDALARTMGVEGAVATGRNSVERVAAVMTEVATATNASTAVIQEIDAFAAQTDGLAVTASAEAGKVAASGRGFAVVADEVRRLAQQSKTAANKIDSLMVDVRLAISRSSDGAQTSSQDAIGAVVQEIQQIAFQTNMLAVNAAVEAAHVSAASSGFEKITEEVRDLARRAKAAAERTATLTRTANGAAACGQDITQELQENFSAIVTGASSITESIKVIASASESQLEGMRAMAQAMSDIQEVTDGNAASAAVSAAVAENLKSETATLSSLVSRFRLGSQNPSAESSVPKLS